MKVTGFTSHLNVWWRNSETFTYSIWHWYELFMTLFFINQFRLCNPLSGEKVAKVVKLENGTEFLVFFFFVGWGGLGWGVGHRQCHDERAKVL